MKEFTQARGSGRYNITYQTGFSFHCLGHVPGFGYRKGGGSKIIYSKIQPNLVLCYSHEWYGQRHDVFGAPLGLEEEAKD